MASLTRPLTGGVTGPLTGGVALAPPTGVGVPSNALFMNGKPVVINGYYIVIGA